MTVMRFAHLTNRAAARWAFRMTVVRFAHVPGRPCAKWQNRMLRLSRFLTRCR
jgi:hypothetical protein